jgi:hypothetical protein
MADYEILTYTPRLRLQYQSLLRKAIDWYEEVAGDLGVETVVISNAIGDFLQMSVRVSGLNGDVDFDFASPQDTPEAVREKFNAYLDTEQMDMVDKIFDDINTTDAPANPETAPTAPTEKKV